MDEEEWIWNSKKESFLTKLKNESLFLNFSFTFILNCIQTTMRKKHGRDTLN